jgi:structural maintenance of chromosome 3 (chondroitin sulfate proteoglycan 6)
LLLLKEVAGTTVYDEKKAESLAKMQENTASIEKIQEILSEIQQRLADLQEEKEELSQYQQLDRQRRALEYTLYDKELRKTRTVLDGLEHDRAEHVTVVSDLHASAKQTHDAIQSVEDILKTKSNVLRRHKVSLQNYEDDARGAITRVAKLELQRKEGASSLKSLQEQANQNQKDLQQVEREIKQTQKLLDTDVQPAYDKAVEELNQLQDARQDNKRQLDSLLAKQGRAKQFSSKADRDAFLKESIQDLQTSQNCKQEQLQQEQTSLANTRRSMVAETRELEQTSQKVTSMTGKLHALTKNIDDSKKQRLDLIQRRKEYQRQKEDLQEQVREAREQYHRALSNVRKVMPKATAMGMEALKSVVEQEGLTSNEYFGMVMDNFTLTNENYQVAVEVAAQNSLFHVIVDTDQTAARLMKRLEDGKLGRVTFLPLNQLVVDNTVQYPDHNDVRPMLELCLNFDPKVERAMKHVFAKKLLARNPQVASEWSAKLKMDAITLEGDLCSRKGALTGGYVDVNKSRLRAHDERNKAHEALRVIEREYQTLNQQVQRSDQEATNVMSELQRLESKHADLSHRLSETESTVARLTVRQETQKKQCEKLEKETIPIIEKEVASLQADIDRLDEEIGTELVETLSAADRRIVQDLKQDQVQLGPKIEMQTDIVAKAGVERQKLLSLLNDNLLKRRRELTEGGIATTTTDEDDEDDDSSGHRTSFSRFSSVTLLQDQLQADLNQHNRDLDEAIRIKEDLESRVERAREEVQILQEELVKAKNQLEQLKGEDTQNRLDLEEAHDKAERLLNKV